jgi:hypothetical protein
MWTSSRIRTINCQADLKKYSLREQFCFCYFWFISTACREAYLKKLCSFRLLGLEMICCERFFIVLSS